MPEDGFNSNPEGKYVNTLIRCNQFKEMEEARQNRYNRFLSGCPNRIGSGEPHSLTVADRSPELISVRMITRTAQSRLAWNEEG
jgi:hypothetical protein